MFFIGKPMREFILHIALLVVVLVGGGSGTLSAQELRLGADFTTLFDNREYAGMEFDESGTLFSARLTPKVGVAWAEHNELTFAVDMVQDFGHNSKFLSDTNVQLYYAYRAPRVKVLAGIFPRSEMRGLDSPLFFDRTYRYYHNRIGGVLARYEDDKYKGSYVEFALDYTGMRDFDTREAFMIMSSGRMNIDAFYFGYDFYMGHYAKDYNPETRDGVVDNLMLTPYAGYRFSANKRARPINFDLRMQYVQSLQRDRINEHKWQYPCGAELVVEVEWYDVRLSNRLYTSWGRLFTYYDRYGSDVYFGQPIYNVDKGAIYEAINLSYARRFFDDTLAVEAGITMEYDGRGWGTRQWLQLSVDLDYAIGLKRKTQVVD